MMEEYVAFLDELSVLIDRERNRVTGQSGLDPVNAMVAELRGRCQEIGLMVDPSGYVGESAAAELLGLVPQTMRNRRCQGKPPKWSKSPNNRIRYSLAHLAEYLTSCGPEEDYL